MLSLTCPQVRLCGHPDPVWRQETFPWRTNSRENLWAAVAHWWPWTLHPPPQIPQWVTTTRSYSSGGMSETLQTLRALTLPCSEMYCRGAHLQMEISTRNNIVTGKKQIPKLTLAACYVPYWFRSKLVQKIWQLKHLFCRKDIGWIFNKF